MSKLSPANYFEHVFPEKQRNPRLPRYPRPAWSHPFRQTRPPVATMVRPWALQTFRWRPLACAKFFEQHVKFSFFLGGSNAPLPHKKGVIRTGLASGPIILHVELCFRGPQRNTNMAPCATILWNQTFDVCPAPRAHCQPPLKTHLLWALTGWGTQLWEPWFVLGIFGVCSWPANMHQHYIKGHTAKSSNLRAYLMPLYRSVSSITESEHQFQTSQVYNWSIRSCYSTFHLLRTLTP